MRSFEIEENKKNLDRQKRYEVSYGLNPLWRGEPSPAVEHYRLLIDLSVYENFVTLFTKTQIFNNNIQ